MTYYMRDCEPGAAGAVEMLEGHIKLLVKAAECDLDTE